MPSLLKGSIHLYSDFYVVPWYEYIILYFFQDAADLESRKIGSMLLERRSLLILQEDLYTKYLHGIRELTEDVLDDNVMNLSMCDTFSRGDIAFRTTTRYSLTIRHFPKVLKLKLQLCKKVI